jgi:hypothetical protein
MVQNVQYKPKRNQQLAAKTLDTDKQAKAAAKADVEVGAAAESHHSALSGCRQIQVQLMHTTCTCNAPDLLVGLRYAVMSVHT